MRVRSQNRVDYREHDNRFLRPNRGQPYEIRVRTSACVS